MSLQERGGRKRKAQEEGPGVVEADLSFRRRRRSVTAGGPRGDAQINVSARPANSRNVTGRGREGRVLVPFPALSSRGVTWAGGRAGGVGAPRPACGRELTTTVSLVAPGPRLRAWSLGSEQVSAASGASPSAL